ncbi:MAG: hypothetical protein RRC34_05355 [Lentisphaeria bacterium]|nr:hypothetical protein [Lentisphaeria bacterium]
MKKLLFPHGLFVSATMCAAAFFAGCATAPETAPIRYTWEKHGPFAVRLNAGVTWTSRHPRGFDPALPGYHLSGDIASFRITPAADQPPERFVLAITTPGREKHLDLFRLSFSGISIECEPFNDRTPTRITATDRQRNTAQNVPKGTFFDVEVKGKEIHVTFKPTVIKLMRGECSVSWIDRYRN